MFQVAGTIILVALVAVLVMAALGPCLVQNLTNDSVGSDDTASGNIRETFRQWNDKAENSGLAEWLAEMDARSE
jgi:hypothetical protein